jgi:hypothetical protein
MALKYYVPLYSYAQVTDGDSVPNRNAVIELITDAIKGVFKAPVLVATAAALSSATYNATDGTITLAATLNVVVDGHYLSLGDRILVKDEANKYSNGIYDVTTVGNGSNVWVLTRSDDLDSDADFYPNFKVSVIKGSTNKDSIWQLITDEPAILSAKEFGLVFSTNEEGVTRYSYVITSTDTDGTNDSFEIYHGINDQFVTVNIIDADTKEDVYFNVVRSMSPPKVIVSVADATAIAGKKFVVQVTGVPGITYTLS